MKIIPVFFILFLCKVETLASQIQDTLIDVGNHHLHFYVLKGKGIPILFENGSGDEASIWDPVLKQIHQITGTTLITYERAGFGKSTLDTTENAVSKHGILSNIEDLEQALQKLGYNNQLLLVSHSYGGYLTTLFAARHPELVRSIVLIDVAHNFYYTDPYLKQTIVELDQEKEKLKKTNPALYYQFSSFAETIHIVSKLSIPPFIPVIDFVNGIPFKKKKEQAFWKACHKNFVESRPNTIGITAYGCGHYIWLDNPALVIMTISKAYADLLDDKERIKVNTGALNESIRLLNERKK